MKDYYELLEVSQNASDEIISRAYKVLAKKYHPDMNPENPTEAEEKFKEITEAYEVLSNPDKKREYDIKLVYEKKRQNEKKETTNTSYEHNTNDSNNVASNKADDLVAPLQVNVDRINEILKEHENAVEKAYNDAYINALKNMGYEIRYEKTFKEKVQGFLKLLTFLFVIAIVLLVLFQVPAVKEKFAEIYNSIPFLKNFVNSIKSNFS